MGVLTNLFTTAEIDSFKFQVKVYMKVILCITIGIMIYSAVKDIINRYLSGYTSFIVKSIIAFILLVVITKI